MAIVVKSIPRAQVPQPAEEAVALENSLNYGGPHGRLVQVLESHQPGFLLAIFDEV
jgi:hypothetical protein